MRAALLWAAPLAVACGSPPELLPPPPVPEADPGSVETSLFLIGDAGAPAPEEPVLRALRTQVDHAPGKPVIVFIGDNIYPRGLPSPGDAARPDAERRILAQIRVSTETRTPTYFVPGNHDWGIMGAGGWGAIQRQSAYVDSAGAPYARFLPRGGCPGPEVVDIGERVRLILLDTQWWLHEFGKPVDPTSACPTDSPREITDSLDHAMASATTVALAGHPRRHIIVVGHHPVVSVGQHGGFYTWQQQVFPLRRISRFLWIPLPLLGSYEVFIRRGGGTNQDVFGPLYRAMRTQFERVFRKYHPLAYVSGHDHGLQVNRQETMGYQLVSGAGIYGHASPVGHRDYTQFAAAESGFMRLDVLRDGRVRLAVLVVDGEGEANEVFSEYLEVESGER